MSGSALARGFRLAVTPLLFAAATGEAQSLPSAAELLERNRAATFMDGPPAKHQTMLVMMTQLANGVELTIELRRRDPDRFLSILSVPRMGEYRTGWDGTNAWRIDPARGASWVVGPEAEQLKKSVRIDPTALDTAGITLTVVGQSDFEGRRVWELRGTRPDSAGSVTMYLDLETALLAGFSAKVGTQDLRTIVREYGTFSGMRVPRVVESISGGLRTTTTMTRMEFDTLSEADFAPPAEVLALKRP